MQTEKVLYLMCGLAFSGKTTLANQIAARTEASTISLDDINAERNLHGGQGISDHEWGLTHQVALQILDRLASEGSDVIVDDTNCFRWLRDNYRIKVMPYGYRSIVVLLDVPLSTIYQRAAENAISGSRPAVLPHIMQELVNKFEYPDEKQEETIRYSPDQQLDEWLVTHFTGTGSK